MSGSFAFQATYSGDGTYTGSTGPCEPLTVTTVASTHGDGDPRRRARDGDVGAGGDDGARPGDGDRAPSGDADGDGDVLVVHQRHLHRTGGGDVGAVHADAAVWRTATTFTQTPNVSGSFAFQATYSGDGTYTGSTGPCEPLTVTTVASTHGDGDPRRGARDGDVGAGGDDGARPGDGDRAGRSAGADGDGDVHVVHQRRPAPAPAAATSTPFTLDGSGVADGTTFTQTPNVSGSVRVPGDVLG